MSANPTNADLGLTEETTTVTLAPAADSPHAQPRREALQALLAFSALHEQIRQRRQMEAAAGRQLSPEDAWELEQFVLDEVLQLVAERALAITGADGVAIALAEGDEIICRGSAGEIAPDAGARLDPNSGFSGACFRTGKIIRCDDAENDPRVNVNAARRLQAMSMVAVPLAGQGCVVGLLEAFSYDAYGFNDSDVRSLSLLAELILAALRPEEEDRLAEISRRLTQREPEVPSQSAQESAESQGNESAIKPTQEPADPAVAAVPDLAEVARERSRPGMMVVLAIVVVAVALGGGVWWNMHRKVQSAAASPPTISQSTAQAPPLQSTPPASEDDELAVDENPSPKQQLSVLPQVTGIRHWSSADSSTVVIDLQDQVQYEAHRLTNPDRIYFDLHDTALAPGLSGKSVEVGDALLARVRVAQPMAGVTRVVLETRGGSNFSVSLDPNPYRLVVEVRQMGASAKPRSRVDLFAPLTPAQTETARGTRDTGNLGRAPKFTLVLDAGHGGWDLGTVGRKGLLEKNLVLDIVDRLGTLVEKRLGAEVIYTREDDNYVPLEKRAEIANQANADLFLSIHANYSDLPSARGVETFYTNTFSSVNAQSRDVDPAQKIIKNIDFANVDLRDKVEKSRELAASVQKSLFHTLAAANPGIRNRGVKKASYVVLTGTTMPAVLAEVSFVSSPTDESNLQSAAYRQQIAEALYQGIARYASTPRRVKIVRTSGRSTGR